MNNDIVGGFDDEEMAGLAIRLAAVPALDGCLVIRCTGWFDNHNCRQFQVRVRKAIAAGFTRLVFDLHAVSHLSGMLLGALVAILRTVKAKDGDLVLQGVPPRLYEVFELLGFSQFFPFTPALEDSVAHFSRRPAPVIVPRVVACPICEARLRAVRAGRFRCPHCRTILALAATGAVDVG